MGNWILLAVIFGVALYSQSETVQEYVSGTVETVSGWGGSMLEAFAEAIKKFEGWFEGSRSYRNNNPGNLKGGQWGGVVGVDPQGFLIFDSYQSGWNALLAQLRLATQGGSRVYNPSMTLQQFFERYAPSSDNNHPAEYAAFVAKEVGVTPDTQISQLV